ncbi:uncharacterized protein LOC110020416 isoform X2 [Phalaenopsis equestris]|uniref:uncharacterized protein LOC110020416 isoform X2 n=1 Tax=Phalaenopsis equestris TaxID=78828 RepID=UPI0009E4BAF5|nr:uncharacterized protein LOC110020416 isoform X2 [Phalaenopsis equestris]
MWAAPTYSVATAASLPHLIRRDGFLCRAEAANPNNLRKKVVVIGAGWAGLASAHHLCKQGIDVTIIDARSFPAEEVTLRGFWSPYRNIFSIMEELGLQPFTNWTSSSLYTSEGVEVKFPIFQDLPRLPAPLGALVYSQFSHLSLADHLASTMLIAAVIDFDGTDAVWRKYDAMTARELFKQFGCSERLYREAFLPFIEAGLLAPAEQCSAAAALSMLYYYALSHQKNFDVAWCRGTVQEKIFNPWRDFLKSKGCNFHGNKKMTDFIVNKSSGGVTGVICGNDVYEADAFVLAVRISTLKSTVISSCALQSRQEFLNVLNLSEVDVVKVKILLDRKVRIPRASNVCFGNENSTSWTFFDLNSIFDEYQDETSTILEAEFYYANQLLPLKDEQIVAKLISYLSRCIKEFQEAIVIQQIVSRFPKSATHFFPGSYKYMMKGSTSFQNLFMAGDWIITRHGSCAKEKAVVTGLEAANQVVDYLGAGEFARIIPVEDDEPHIETLRELNRRLNELRAQAPFSDFFLQ